MEERGELPKGTAKRWAEETPNIKKLPERVGKMASKKSAAKLAKAAAEAHGKMMGQHKMPGGHMMSDKEMADMMGGGGGGKAKGRGAGKGRGGSVPKSKSKK